MADHDEDVVTDDVVADREAAAAAAVEAKAEVLRESSAQRPEQEEGESISEYVRRLRELQVAETRTDQ